MSTSRQPSNLQQILEKDSGTKYNLHQNSLTSFTLSQRLRSHGMDLTRHCLAMSTSHQA
jgi:hypothetical protein